MAFADPEAARRYQREWKRKKRQADPEAHRAANRASHQANRESRLASMDAYREAHRDELAAREQRRRDSRTAEERRDIWLRQRYGFTLEDFNRLAAEQDWRCAICGDKEPLFVDHDHRCDQGHAKHKACSACRRGLICRNCNLGLGHLGDSPTQLSAALAYLLSYSQEP